MLCRRHRNPTPTLRPPSPQTSLPWDPPDPGMTWLHDGWHIVIGVRSAFTDEAYLFWDQSVLLQSRSFFVHKYARMNQQLEVIWFIFCLQSLQAIFWKKQQKFYLELVPESLNRCWPDAPCRFGIVEKQIKQHVPNLTFSGRRLKTWYWRPTRNQWFSTEHLRPTQQIRSVQHSAMVFRT